MNFANLHMYEHACIYLAYVVTCIRTKPYATLLVKITTFHTQVSYSGPHMGSSITTYLNTDEPHYTHIAGARYSMLVIRIFLY